LTTYAVSGGSCLLFVLLRPEFTSSEGCRERTRASQFAQMPNTMVLKGNCLGVAAP
jgi:hypothetical protein